ncbi:ATP-binding protein [Actinomadura alba]|uniref:ATP-binding protein n=1 Tax=Actinomadura alba TaxID=406431 RepID=A0ABR7LTM6_9ACTN|nr:ATP-binding protein [Actinomadura alba]MBC6467924.1 ATP-binding protein [Actinomadura alba]
MDARDAWPDLPAFSSGSPFEFLSRYGRTAGWSDAVASGGFLGEIVLAATPAAVRPARSYVRELVGEYFATDRSRLGDLELLTSEAMTNSLMHAKPRRDGTLMLSALHIDRLVRVGVTDGGSRHEEPRAADDPHAVNGWGLHLIEALATGYGTHRNLDGTATFWFGAVISERWKAP